jgi:hypothetical protein
LGLLGVLLSPVAAQEKAPPVKQVEDEYRRFFKKPETALEYWAAMRFNIEVGKFNLAAEDFKGFLAKKPTDAELLQIEEEQGMAAFLRLLNIPELRADARPLIDRVTAVVKAHRSNPERLRKFIRNLDASPEERAYALTELRRAGPAAVPYLIDALRAAGTVQQRARLLSAVYQLTPDSVPPLLAALDLGDPNLQLELIEIFRQRADAAVVPYLWYPWASPRAPEAVRLKAQEALMMFLDVKRPDQLPPAKAALAREAEKYYRHQVRFPQMVPTTVWGVANGKLVSQPLTASQAEEFYGLTFARQALDLDPAYEPAQIVFLSLALEKGFERAGLDQPLDKGAPEVKLLLRVVNPELIMTVLERALSEHRLPVILGAVRALGDLGEVRALRPLNQKPPALLKALYYPDRRVQLAAAGAVLSIPSATPSTSAARIVEILRRTLAAEPTPRAIVADFNKDRANAVGQGVREAGYTPLLCYTGNEVLRRLAEAADVDVLFVDYAIPDPALPYLLAQLRGDVDAGRLPVFVTVHPDAGGKVPPGLEESLQRLTQHFQNVWIIPTTTAKEPLQQIIAARLTEAMGKPLSAEERKANAREALTWLKRLATQEVPGYDVRAAEGAVVKALHDNELALLAVETAGRLPGSTPQRELAQLMLDTTPPPPVRAAAAAALSQHIQRYGLTLGNELVKGLQDLYQAADDPKLKSSLALVLGSLDPAPAVTGARLLRFAPAPVPPPKEK